MTTSTYNPTFLVIPGKIKKLPGLTLQLLWFYEAIFQFWHHDMECFLTNDALKERTGMKSDSTISSAFAYFEKHGLLKRITIDGRRYLVKPEKLIEEPKQIKKIKKQVKINNIDKISRVSPQRGGGSRHSEGEGLATARHNNNNLNNNNINKSFYAPRNNFVNEKYKKDQVQMARVDKQSTSYDKNRPASAKQASPMLEEYMKKQMRC